MPFHCTDAELSKFVPLTVSVKTGPPATAALGFIEDIVGGAMMVNVALFEVCPLSNTVTVAEPGVAIRLAGTVASNCVALTKAVVRGPPFHCTIAPLSKFEPLTTSMTPAAPARAELGFNEVITGAGGTMVKVALFEVEPSSDTVTVAVPALAMRSAVTVAVNCESLTKFVARPPLFHCTTAAASNPDPLTVSVNC